MKSNYKLLKYIVGILVVIGLALLFFTDLIPKEFSLSLILLACAICFIGAIIRVTRAGEVFYFGKTFTKKEGTSMYYLRLFVLYFGLLAVLFLIGFIFLS